MIIISSGVSVSAEDGQNKSSTHPTVEERIRTLEEENAKLEQIINELYRRIGAIEKQEELQKAEKMVEPEVPDEETLLESAGLTPVADDPLKETGKGKS